MYSDYVDYNSNKYIHGHNEMYTGQKFVVKLRRNNWVICSFAKKNSAFYMALTFCVQNKVN